jgi:glycosyltransferase involved in cell wall biosynthesis
MRIAQISTLATPVREHGSGSVEGLVWLLTRELVRQGHDVTVFGAAGSETCGEFVANLPGTYAAAGCPHDWQLCEWVNLCRAAEQSRRFDVLHSHAYLWGLPLEPLSRARMLHTLHVLPGEDQVRLWAAAPDACVTAISRYQWHAYPGQRPAAVIYHGVDPLQFAFRSEPEDYVLFLGRFTWGKGPLAAIAAARSLGLRLLLAGPPDDFFRAHVEPLVDGRSVEFVGYVTGAERARLLGGAKALLYPIQYPEPFGLVLVEAMMCGTPVAAIALGAVPEVVDEGVTGCCAPSAERFEEAVLQALLLDRRRVREWAETRFSAARMARDYLAVYEQLVSGRAAFTLPALATPLLRRAG